MDQSRESSNLVKILRWVDFNYPRDTGLQQRLESEGYQVAWSNDDKVSRKTELEGWEIVLEPDTNAIPTHIKLKTQPQDQTLIKKRIS